MHDTLGGRYEAGAIARSEHIPESTRSFSARTIGTLYAFTVSVVEAQTTWSPSVCTSENGHDLASGLAKKDMGTFRTVSQNLVFVA
jgi:hypothetical protein